MLVLCLANTVKDIKLWAQVGFILTKMLYRRIGTVCTSSKRICYANMLPDDR